MVRAQHGFTLIEVMVALTVLAILISLGAPSFAEWLQSQRIRASAEAIVNGMQAARAEAIKQNLPVVVGLEPPMPGWTVCLASVTPCDSTTPAADVIQSKSGQAGAGGARIVQTPNDVTRTTFTPLGALLAKNPDGTLPVARVDVFYDDPALCIAAGGTKRCLRVVVSGGGSIRMCDPAPTIVAPDPRVCP
jgi:type IV fimbrial biogenesis protein FimT